MALTELPCHQFYMKPSMVVHTFEPSTQVDYLNLSEVLPQKINKSKKYILGIQFVKL